MANVHRRRADIPEPAVARSETEIDVLQIATRIIFANAPHGVEAVTGDVEAETDTIGNVDHAPRIDPGGNLP